MRLFISSSLCACCVCGCAQSLRTQQELSAEIDLRPIEVRPRSLQRAKYNTESPTTQQSLTSPFSAYFTHFSTPSPVLLSWRPFYILKAATRGRNKAASGQWPNTSTKTRPAPAPAANHSSSSDFHDLNKARDARAQPAARANANAKTHRVSETHTALCSRQKQL